MTWRSAAARRSPVSAPASPTCRETIDKLETALANREQDVLNLMDDLAAAERRIEERDTWQPHH